MKFLREEIRSCLKCPLGQHRIHCVLDRVPSDPLLMLVGEAPGGHEATVTGVPFSGQAGKILDNFLLSIDLPRQALYISNLVKCRPIKEASRPRYGGFANRTPSKKEIDVCGPFLDREIALVAPKLIVTLGATAFSWFYSAKVPMKDIHGQLYYAKKYKTHVFALYHPASLIYRPALTEDYQQDIKRLYQLIHKEGKIDDENICHI